MTTDTSTAFRRIGGGLAAPTLSTAMMLMDSPELRRQLSYGPPARRARTTVRRDDRDPPRVPSASSMLSFPPASS
jgi:hypothetical protein